MIAGFLLSTSLPLSVRSVEVEGVMDLVGETCPASLKHNC